MGYNSKTVKNYKPVENEMNDLISDDSKPISTSQNENDNIENAEK